MPGVLTASQISVLLQAIETAKKSNASGVRKSRSGETFGIRNLLQLAPEVRQLAVSSAFMNLVAQVLGPGAFPVRGLYFDRTPDANWKVPWHQDLAIAVSTQPDNMVERFPGFGPWSMKSGIPHVEPPSPYLERRLALRLHLDPCGADNGPLRVLPGTHRLGRLSESQVTDIESHGQAVTCQAEAGDVLLMNPMTLHASSPASAPAHRRVIHIEYGADHLPEGLSWFEEFGTGLI